MKELTIYVTVVWTLVCIGAGVYIYIVNKGYKKRQRPPDDSGQG